MEELIYAVHASVKEALPKTVSEDSEAFWCFHALAHQLKTDWHALHPPGKNEEYRPLEKGEIIQEGDEVDACNDAWRDAPIWERAWNCIGEPATDPQFVSHRQYRRRIPDLREKVAALAHEVWAGWMKYQFSLCQDTKWLDGPRIAIPADREDRWRRQMNTPYDQLPEDEKKSDREIADKYLALLEK